MKYRAITFTINDSGLAFQNIELSDTPAIMTIKATNIPSPIMEMAEETLSDIDIDKMEIYTYGNKPNIIYKNIYISSAKIENDKLILEIEKG